MSGWEAKTWKLNADWLENLEADREVWENLNARRWINILWTVESAR